MSSELVGRLRQSRDSGAVLKTKLSNLRSRHRRAVILVFEGPEDLGPYTAWIGRVDDSLRFEPLIGNGKDQVLDLRDRLQADEGGLAKGVYLFVDRDFDDLKGRQPGGDLFCTDRYSIENYLVTEEVVQQVLLDEFRCTAEEEDRGSVLELFRRLKRQFVAAMDDPNRRIYIGTRLGIRGKGIEDSINRYVQISLTSVEVIFDKDGLRMLIPLSREPEEVELGAAGREFRELNPSERHRGKYQLAFLLRWLDLLGRDRCAPTPTIFSKRRETKFSIQKLALGWMAARSPMPIGLPEFVRGMAPVPG